VTWVHFVNRSLTLTDLVETCGSVSQACEVETVICSSDGKQCPGIGVVFIALLTRGSSVLITTEHRAHVCVLIRFDDKLGCMHDDRSKA
jgi:hypothetical protein